MNDLQQVSYYRPLCKFRAYVHSMIVLYFVGNIRPILSSYHDNGFKFMTKVFFIFFIIENGNVLLKSPLHEKVPVKVQRRCSKCS